jgi:hypothetical protein
MGGPAHGRVFITWGHECTAGTTQPAKDTAYLFEEQRRKTAQDGGQPVAFGGAGECGVDDRGRDCAPTHETP